MRTQPDSPPVAVAPEELPGLTWRGVFGDERPVELEIGVGKGAFLLRRAKALPEVNFFGIEWANEFYRYAVDRMQRWKIPNVRLLRDDASRFIREVCPRNSLSVLHVYHPDPWPKARHHKRRLIQPAFVDAAVQCLVPGGRWAIQTDHEEYFGIIRGLLTGHPELTVVDFDEPGFGVEHSRIATNFEIKYEKEGRAFYRIAVRRRPAIAG